MALWDILAGASGGLRQGLDDLRQRQLQDEQRQRQAALDARSAEQFELQKKQITDSQARQQFQDQVTKFNLTEALLGGLTSGRHSPEYVRQYGGQMGLSLPEMGQRQVTREVRTEASRPSPGFMGPMPSVKANLTSTEQFDPLADMYDRDRRLALADEQRKLEIQERAILAERAWREKMARDDQAAALKRTQVQESGANSRVTAERQYAPMFDTVVGGDGFYWTVDKRTGQRQRTEIKAPPRSSLDAFGGGDTEALAQEAISRLLSGK